MGHQVLQYAYARGGSTWHFRHPGQGEFSRVVPTLPRTNNADALMPARVQALIEYLAASFVREPGALDAESRA